MSDKTKLEANPASVPVDCPDHVVPLLPDEKVEAFCVLLDWRGATVVEHACEARLVIRKDWADAVI